ncbi:MAG: ABC transporter permease [Deltaproteobacteria bacterium]|nr:ABC transporter permease [Deltaproteobacteria bacterium]
MEAWVFSNIVVAILITAAVGLTGVVLRSRMWSNAFLSLWRRRRVAIIAIGFYVLVALLDSVSWVGGEQFGEDAVAKYQAQSILDRAFAGIRERSYSAPLASVEFYGGAPLVHPGRHLLGTDLLGRDVLHLALKGARVALLIGGLTSLIAIPLALLFGVSAGYFGGRIDDFVFFIMSTLASMPGLLLLITLIMVMGKSTFSVCIALAVTGWVGFCRMSRGETIKLRELEYISAARALGVGEMRIIFRHILPNLAHLVIITFVLMFSGLVLSEAILSWLGIGVDGSWGQMIDQARDELSRDPIVWWNISAAGSALFGLILAVNFVGDALRDVMDPRTLREGE